MGLLFRVGLVFEPLAPTAISFFLSRNLLREWKQKGLILDYEIHSKRLGKFHYKVNVDMDVNANQTHHFFAHVLPKYSKTYGRWLNDYD
jgi:hypothetical protein